MLANTNALVLKDSSSKLLLQNDSNGNLNGKTVDLERFDAAKKVWRARVDGVGKATSVKGDHLRLIYPTVSQQQAVIQNIEKHPDLNGRKVSLGVYHADRGRYECSAVGGKPKTFALLPEKLSNDGNAMKPPVVRLDSALGQTTVATKNFKPGDVIFVEKPLWSFNYGDAPRIGQSGPAQIDSNVLISSFLELPEEKRQQLLSLLPIDKMRGCSREEIDKLASYADLPELDDSAMLSSMQHVLKTMGEPSSQDVARSVLRFMKVMKNNSFKRTNSIAILLHHSRVNHSCRPNVNAGAERADGTYELVAMRHIQVGEELSLSYKERVPLQPRAKRQQILAGWFPECGCSRCQDPADDVRRFRCALDCGGHCCAMWQDDTVGPCVRCSAEWSTDQAKALLRAEARVGAAIEGYIGKTGTAYEDWSVMARSAMDMVITARASGLAASHWQLAELHECMATALEPLLHRGVTAVFQQLLFHAEEWQAFNDAVDAPPSEESCQNLMRLALLYLFCESHRHAAKSILLALDDCRHRGQQVPADLANLLNKILPGVQIPLLRLTS